MCWKARAIRSSTASARIGKKAIWCCCRWRRAASSTSISILSRRKARRAGLRLSICRSMSTSHPTCSRSKTLRTSIAEDVNQNHRMARGMKPRFGRSLASAIMAAGLTAFCAAPQTAQAQAPVSFEGKTINFVVGFSAGGGTDASARVIAPYLTKYLPGNPTVIVSNMPGADGMTAMNTFVQPQRTPADGTAITMGSTTTSDPLQYRRPQSHFDPTKFHFIGGVPRSGMQSTAWGIAYLGWNAKWVVGYRGTQDLFIALQRGEIDMTATGNVRDVQHLIDNGTLKILTQSGTVRNGELSTRPE